MKIVFTLSAVCILAVFPFSTTAQTSPLATSTALTVTPASVVYGKPVTLAARVSADDFVSSGQVIFCDTAAAHCNPVLSLATAQIGSNGFAMVTVHPAGIGSHSYKAVFLANGSFQTSTSSAQTATVTGVYPSSTTISSTGTGGSYSLLATVVGLGSRTLSPSGLVSFNDTSNTAVPLLGTAALGASTPGFNEAQPHGSPITVGAAPYGLATGDFNGDGFVDFVVENYEGDSVSVLLGKGDGTFQDQVTYPVGVLPERVLVADFDGDGNLDLVVANTGSDTISILLGNGDGTFQEQVTYECGSPVGLAVMDVDNDGYADVVASDYYNNSVSVFINKGDGTFKAAVTYQTGGTPQTLAEGDFNGDGNVDLAVGNLSNGNVGIFLGNGDGTFQAMVTYPTGSSPMGVQVGDFDGDGVEDLAVSNSGDGTVSVLLGKGNGTFKSQVTYPVGSDPVGLVIADFNGDGFQDISVGNTGQTSLSQSVLLGKGDGTFQPQVTYPMGNFPYGVAVGDFNGDGFPDMAIAEFSDGTATILLSQVTQTATATLNVSLSPVDSTHNVDASYPGDTNFGASLSNTIPLAGGTTSLATLAAISPATGVTGSPATTITLTGTNFLATDVVLLNGAAIPSTFVSSTALTATIPATFFAAAGTGQVAVSDGTVVSASLPFVVITPPAVVFSGPPSASSGEQPMLTLQLVKPYAVAVTGVLTLTFVPDSGTAVDPALQFSTGGPTLTFTIPANSTTTPTVQLQTGTIAGTVTVTLSITANGANVTPADVAPVVISVPTAVPLVTTAALVRTSDTLTLTMHGYSNTREVKSAVFHFTPTPGNTLRNPDITVDVSGIFAGWFGSEASGQYGSTFTYSQPFGLLGDTQDIQSVTVTLVNGVGSSVEQIVK